MVRSFGANARNTGNVKFSVNGPVWSIPSGLRLRPIPAKREHRDYLLLAVDLCVVVDLAQALPPMTWPWFVVALHLYRLTWGISASLRIRIWNASEG